MQFFKILPKKNNIEKTILHLEYLQATRKLIHNYKDFSLAGTMVVILTRTLPS